MFSYCANIGSFYPFYSIKDPDTLSYRIGAVIKKMPPEDRKIDPVGVLEILSRGHLVGDRTLVRGICRAPWMAYPEGGDWRYASIPPHGKKLGDLNGIASEFKQALSDEARMYLAGRKRVGLLLSGGMDSRMVAGILRELQLAGEYSGDVVGLTWGVEKSRDVVYAAEIARRYGWEWEHYPLSPENLRENILLTGIMGAEFAPTHLHAMPKVARRRDLDAVFVGNYGDGVGRAVFSGRRVRKLGPILPAEPNEFGLIRQEVLCEALPGFRRDAYDHRSRIFREEEYQYREIEYVMHCIRRRTQGCLCYVQERIPVCQFFTSPRTVGIMWELDPALRDDRIYAHLLHSLPGHLGDIPWSKTGRPFGDKDGSPDMYLKEHHQYGIWMRGELRSFVHSLVHSEEIQKLGILNERALGMIMKLWPRSRTLTTNRIDETVSWLASLAVFIRSYGIRPAAVSDRRYRMKDHINSLQGFAKAYVYQSLRDRLRA